MRESALEYVYWQIFPFLAAKRALGNDPCVRHSLDRGGNVLMAPLAYDGERIQTGIRSGKHRRQYRRIKGEYVNTPSSGNPSEYPYTWKMQLSSKIAIAFTPPMECLPVARIPAGDLWVYELKLDGYRAQAIRDGAGIRLLSRRGKDLSKKYPLVTRDLLQAIEVGTALDGELVAFDDEGTLSFNALQNAASGVHVVFFAFDILVSEGKDVKTLALRDRKEILKSTIKGTEHVQLSEYFGGSLANFLRGVKDIGGEGVVAKQLDRPYEPGRRSGSWSKMRINIGQEFVIGGFTPGSNGVDALIVGYYEGGKLIYAARVRAGLVPASRRELYDRLKPLITPSCPFKNLPEATAGRWGQGLTAEKMKNCVWVRPRIVANFEFLQWTDSNHVRHIKFSGLRNDKDPRAVVRE